MASVLETSRLKLRRLRGEDAGFMLELLNDPAFVRYIGDRGVRTLDDARDYIGRGPVASYREHGFGLYLVERRQDAEAIGICGLLRRDSLPDVDLGFALLPGFRRQGYGLEAAAAVLGYARGTLGLGRIVAVTTPENEASIRLLERLGLRFERMVRLARDGPALQLFCSDP